MLFLPELKIGCLDVCKIPIFVQYLFINRIAKGLEINFEIYENQIFFCKFASKQ